MISKIDIKKFFKYALKNVNEILKNEDLDTELKELYNNDSLHFIEKSVCYVLYNRHNYFTNTYKIDIDVEDNHNRRICSYILYLDEDENFIDEFLL
ncbi:hypothetical protein EG359_09100 [Chryseobacterium joostei]|uniref:Uncharacterized protein n=1 Tax=Chryseobacterium joostei TaxID=112234 RepID=A0A1N7I3K0_9FLAO|nr:hypothetical protein [Chryseobacterium joostei]AZA99764.1 hypothetical protein EG359_09100 [Chryseobacterium joostei]SIS31606.1 hypothetical protein SAMN05421768_102467 [Chryseobacterium joostei]